MIGDRADRIRRWWYDRPILVKGLVVVAIPVLPLLVLNLLYFPAQWRAQGLEEEMSWAVEVAQESQELLIPVLNANSSIRGFALSGERYHLDDADRYRARVPPALERLTATLEENPGEGGDTAARRVEERTENALAALDELEQAAEVAVALPSPDTPLPRTVVEEGTAAMDSLRSVLEPLREGPDRVLARQDEVWLDPTGLPHRIVGLASVVGVLGGVLAGVVFSTSVVRRIRRLEDSTERLSRGEELQPGLHSKDELGRLASRLQEARTLLVERERALRESEDRLSKAVTGSRDGLWDWNLETDEIYYSPRWMGMLGYSEEELDDVYETFRTLVHPEDLPRVEQEIRRHLRGETQELSVEIRMKHKDGNWRWIYSRGQCVRDSDGRAIRMAGFHSDVTERRLREDELREARQAAEAATQAKSAFLAAMSHELRTPLNAIIGFSELLEDGTAGELNEKQTAYMGNVLSSARHLLSLINDILDLSKVEAGKMELHLEELDPVPMLSNSVTIIQGAARKKGVAIQQDLPDELPPLRVDQARLKQAVYNLLSNAVKFTEEGGRVTLGAEATDEELLIRVRDTGIGVPPEDLDRIFGEFEQVESSYARSQQGTGLGLPLTRKLVELHGGRAEVESVPGEGSTFTLRLPLDGPPEAGAGPAETQEPAADPSGERPSGTPGSPTVLVVEDDPSLRRLLRAYLVEEDYTVLEASDGEEALEVARREKPDAITLDIVLPRKDGWQVLRELKEDPETRNIPVLTVTVSEDRELGLTLGNAGFFTKPVDRQALVDAISALVPRGGAGLRILAVDDEDDARTLIRSTLEQQGHEVLTASGGRAGIELARNEMPDLVILDLMMPEVSGFDVAVALREEPGTARIPILVWTAKELTAGDRERLNSKVQEVRVKGSKEDLLEALRRVTSTREDA